MSKSKEYWDDRWEDAEGNDFAKAVALLSEYSGYGSLAKNCWCILDLCGGINRFFSCRWNTNHSKEVRETLKQLDIDHMLFHNEVSSDISDNVNTIENLFGQLKYNLRGKNLKNDGDLFLIIETIEIQTQIKYRHADENSLRRSVEMRAMNSL